MPSKGRKHFDTYTEQNRVKHAILRKYFGAYLNALSRVVDAFHYIDGFAGAGTYEDGQAGSPLYAMELLAQSTKPGTVSLVESDTVSFARLEEAVAAAPTVSKLLEAPLLHRGDFSEHMRALLARSVFNRFRKVGTFAFVDPCGLKDLYLDDLSRILRLPFAECLVFLNYDGLTRWLGGVRAGTHGRGRLERFYGSSEKAAEAVACLQSNAASRETALLEIYVSALRKSSGATFVLPFRFKAIDRNRTSHYLIHLAQHPLAFKIMKEVMKAESSDAGDYGSFGFIPEEELSGQGELFRPNVEHARTEIVEELRHGPRLVRLFVEEWPLRPSDMLIGREYRQTLLELEAEGAIAVCDPRTGGKTPATQRRKRSGEATLGGRYEIHLRE